MDIEWQDGKLTRAVSRNRASPSGACELRYGSQTRRLTVPDGEVRELTGRENLPAP